MKLWARARSETDRSTDGGSDRRRARAKRGRILGGLLLLIAAGLLLAVPAALSENGPPTISSDLADYNPGQTVTLTGTGWASGEAVHVRVAEDNATVTWSLDTDPDPVADADGNFTYSFQLPATFIARYVVTATGPSSGTATTSFTDANSSADLDQCANDQDPSPNTDGCSASASDWVNGNLGASKSVYFEGDSIPYRMRFDNLSLASHTVTIEWDTTKSGKHAIDYLTTFNRTVGTADACLGVSGCGSSTTFPIPADPQVTGAGVTPVAGDFTLYGGTITAVSAYSYPDGTGFAGDKSARITITFTASAANPVLAWGGHISTRKNWGANNSAVAISGSPYHTRLIALDGSGGNQDRSLSADAVIFPGSITIVKEASPEGSTSFPFTASPSPLGNFSLTDDGTSANTKLFSDIKTFQTYTVTETPVPADWGFDSADCSVTSANGGSATEGQTTTINMKEGEDWTCTYLNSIRVGTLIVKKHVVNDNGGTKTAADFNLHVKSSGTDVSGSPAAGSESGTSYTLTGGSYVVSEDAPPTGYTKTGISDDCDSSGNVTVVAGQTKTCTITNNDVAPKLHLRKVVTNDNGGTATVDDFTLTANGTGANDLSGTSPVDSGGTLQADTWALSESSVAGYAASAWVCVGGTQSGSNITVGIGGEATCTITNNDKPAHLKLVKQVINDNGGGAVANDFTLSASGPTPISGAGGAESDVNAGNYGLSETNVSGYTASAWSCQGGTQTGASVKLELGQSATCTITNDDIAPKLHLRKVVINDNGGTATVANFTLTANGTGTNDLSGTSPVDSGAGFKADTWALSETNVYGYTASAWVCVGGTQNGSNITVGIGGEATCTITNDDKPGTIIVRKLIKPAGSLTSFSFQTTGTGYGGFSLAGGQDNTQNLNAGSYTVKELVPLGWVLTGIGGSTDVNTPYNCTVTGSGGSSGVGDLNTQTATISLKNGDTVTCVFENTGQGVTRTQGFWATHPQLAYIAWFGGTGFGHTFPGVANVDGIGDTTLCGRSIDTLGKLMGGFWSDISKTSTGKKRSALDQARMQLLQQLLAAELNASAFGSVPSGGTGTFAIWEAAYCGTNPSSAQQGAASFNSQGDSSSFTPGTSADSKNARAIATYTWWDVLP